MSISKGRRTRGLFVGLSTLDLVHSVLSPPGRNEKIFASDSFIGAGGPATNAAVTFAFLGGKAQLISSVGKHPTGSLILGDLAEYGVLHQDPQAQRTNPPVISSVLVSAENGDRSVVTSPVQMTDHDAGLVSRVLRGALPDFVLVDGHEILLALKAARLAKKRRIPVVFDGGRWKEGFDTLLDHVDHAVVSEAFRSPDGDSPERVIPFLHGKGVRHVAITRGHRSILCSADGNRDILKVPRVAAVDTLAAGDIFHGAYCFGFWGLGLEFAGALRFASEVASQSCRHFGPRQWMESWPPPEA